VSLPGNVIDPADLSKGVPQFHVDDTWPSNIILLVPHEATIERMEVQYLYLEGWECSSVLNTLHCPDFSIDKLTPIVPHYLLQVALITLTTFASGSRSPL